MNALIEKKSNICKEQEKEEDRKRAPALPRNTTFMIMKVRRVFSA